MDRAEYEQKLKELEQKNKEMENEIKMLKQEKIEDDLPEPPHQRSKLKHGDEYYFIENEGETYFCKWDNTEWDWGRLAIGNVFRTIDAAEFAVERLKVLAEMREWAGNWNNAVALTYSKLSNKVEVEIANYTISGEIRFASFADAKNCIKAVGEDRIKKYYFRIPDKEEEEKTDDRE